MFCERKERSVDTQPGDAGLNCQDDLSVAGAHVVPVKGAGIGGVLPTAACDPGLVRQHSLHLP